MLLIIVVGAATITCIELCIIIIISFMHEIGGQRKTFRSLFSPSAMWVLGIELRIPDLAVGAFTC